AAEGREAVEGVMREVIPPVVDHPLAQRLVVPADGELRQRRLDPCRLEPVGRHDAEIATASAAHGPEELVVLRRSGRDVEIAAVREDDVESRDAIAGHAEGAGVWPPSTALHETADAHVAAAAAGEDLMRMRIPKLFVNPAVARARA